MFDATEKNEGAHKEIRSSGRTKLLGMIWKHHEDVLCFPIEKWVSDLTVHPLTKRTVLQATAKIFDPLGLLSPFTIRAKIGFQSIWKSDTTWDDPLPAEESKKWRNFIEEASELKDLQVPRCYAEKQGMTEDSTLHVFADASPLAYGAAAYIVTSNSNGTKATTLMVAKSRVAPIKELTLARLELMAAVLAARLGEYVQKHYVADMKSTHFWTDSMIVLHWINGTSKRESFVENRVAEIRAKTRMGSWSFVQGEDNPADLITRGIKARALIESNLWWRGPTWLASKQIYPDKNCGGDAQLMIEEQSIECNKCTEGTEKPASSILNIENYGSYNRLLRTTAWVLRFIKNLKKEHLRGPLGTQEITSAENYWIRKAQQTFTGHSHSRRKGGNVFQIQGQDVFIDDEGIIRQKGRIQYSKEINKHVIVLPKQGHFTELLVNQVHRLMMHGGVQATLAQLRTRFWILQGRQAVKRVINKCIICKRHNARPLSQVTPPLPADRVTQALPFQVSGVDFTGPLYAADKGQCLKQYVVIFTCAVSRAVHLEVVNNMSTLNFLQAFRRFTARRGIPAIVYSDNAKTFKRAAKDINNVLGSIQRENLDDYCSSRSIKWKLIAEGAPWWGGFYERLIRSLKTSMRKIIARMTITAEELRTVVTEVEGALNNRPLTYVYGEPGEPMPITPADIVGGRQQLNDSQRLILGDIEEAWRSRCRIVRAWWTRWHREYLKEIGATVRTQATPSKALKEGDVVLLGGPGPRTFWEMCRIEKKCTGRDGVTRACLLRRSNKELIRRSTKHIYPLEDCFK